MLLEDGHGIIGIHERAGTEIDGLAGDRRIVRIHHAVDEPHVHPGRHQMCLAAHDRAQQFQVGIVGGSRLRVMPPNDVVGQLPARHRHPHGRRKTETFPPARGWPRPVSRWRPAPASPDIPCRPWRRQPAPASRARPAHAWPRSPDTREAPDRSPHVRRRRARKTCDRCLSTADRGAAPRGRTLRREEWRGHRRVAARNARIGVPRRPWRWARSPARANCRKIPVQVHRRPAPRTNRVAPRAPR